MPSTHTPTTVLVVILLALAVPDSLLPAQGDAPADLRLEWLVRGRPATENVEPLRGREGETLDVPYRLRNVGGTEAFAAVVEATTALGRQGAPERLEPGPEAGEGFDRVLRLAVAKGMQELCIDARLQTLEADEEGDPNPTDNRICRRVEIDDSTADQADPADSRRMR